MRSEPIVSATPYLEIEAGCGAHENPRYRASEPGLGPASLSPPMDPTSLAQNDVDSSAIET
jgi:hypothetical protein